MRSKRSAWGLSLLAFSLSQWARADEPPQALEVEVRGARSGGFSSATSTDSSAREPIDAARLLEDVPGVQIRKLGALGSSATLSVRGSASTQVAILFAGIPMNGASDPSADVANLPVWSGSTFRVYRSFAPATLGASGYLGGVLVVEPPRPVGEARTASWLAVGSFESMKLRITDLRREGDWSFGSAISASRSEGDFTYAFEDPRSRSLEERTRSNARYLAVSGVEHATLERPWGQLGLVAFATTHKQGLPGSATSSTQFADLEGAQGVLGLNALLPLGSNLLRLAGWSRREVSTFRDPKGELYPLKRGALVDETTQAFGSSVSYRLRSGPLEIAAEADGRSERFDSNQKNASAAQVNASRLSLGAGIDATAPIYGTLRINASARMDGFSDDVRGQQAKSRVMPSGNVGLSYPFSRGLGASLHVGTSARAPSFLELYGNQGTLVGDPGLRAERSLTADLGVEGTLRLAGLKLNAQAAVFATRATDLIAFVPLGRSTFRAQNIEEAEIRGLEVSCLLWTKSIEHRATYNLLSTENLSSDPLVYGRALPGRALHDLAYVAVLTRGPFDVRYSLDAIAGTSVDTAGAIKLPARILQGVGGGYSVKSSVAMRLGIDVENVFDVRTMALDSPLLQRKVELPVSDFLGFPLPGRTLWATLRLEAGKGAD